MDKLEKQFIDMCEGLKELEKEWKSKVGDVVIEKRESKSAYYKGRKAIIEEVPSYNSLLVSLHKLTYGSEGGLTEYISNLIFLPTPEQCQEMSGLNWIEFDKRIQDLKMDILRIYFGGSSGIICQTNDKLQSCLIKQTTRNILALQILAKEKWGKDWDGKEWKNEQEAQNTKRCQVSKLVQNFTVLYMWKATSISTPYIRWWGRNEGSR